ncbi:MAG: lytic murein transglycosylase [Methylobacterium sp.]|uniref:lytic murein transglycosylase n=1 Tax=Methylobacterium sp. TaxID=409 RepID=UPI0025889A5A|nr:lytic murein transglycosylase [Methylobacterium sp.]MBY0294887.1 lytic murein transglycosylase [Methylobacterium sp.]
MGALVSFGRCRPALAGAALLVASGLQGVAQAPEAPAPEAFTACTRDLAGAAEAQGIPRALAEEQLVPLTPDPEVLAASRRQAEFETPLWDYLDTATKPSRVAAGQAKLKEWEGPLAAIEARYGVDPHVLVAIWGIESGYGAVLDDPARVRPVIRSLATLACGGGERTALWREELVAALRLLAQGSVPPGAMTGSWAGAMGHTQFMPTTALRHALDFDGDGARDIWRSVPDALASTANYLRGVGWRPGERWGYEVVLPPGLDVALADEVTARPLPEWQRLGLRPAGPVAFAEMQTPARLVLPAGARGPAFLLLPNFDAILRYNTALSYALAVAHLSDRLRGEPGFAQDWPRGDRPLSAEERRELQTGLAARGFPVGGIDGRVGPRTRAAIRAFQAAEGLVPDGYPDPALLDRLRPAR